MGIKLRPDTREAAIASIQRYFLEERDESIGNLGARGLLEFFLAEIGPSIYNQAVADAQLSLQARVMEIDIEVHQDEFQFWRKRASRKPG